MQFSFKWFSKSKSHFGLDCFQCSLILGLCDLESADFEHFTNKDESLFMSPKSSNFAAEIENPRRDNWLTGRPAQHSQSR